MKLFAPSKHFSALRFQPHTSIRCWWASALCIKHFFFVCFAELLVESDGSAVNSNVAHASSARLRSTTKRYTQITAPMSTNKTTTATISVITNGLFLAAAAFLSIFSLQLVRKAGIEPATFGQGILIPRLPIPPLALTLCDRTPPDCLYYIQPVKLACSQNKNGPILRTIYQRWRHYESTRLKVLQTSPSPTRHHFYYIVLQTYHEQIV